MFCRNCGKEIPNQAVVCVGCGSAVNTGTNFCPNCGNPTNPGAAVCTACGVALVSGEAKSKIVAGLLGIFLGGLGIHNFYLGNTNRAIIQIVVSFVTCGIGGIWGFIEGILILCGNIKTDAKGVPLKD